MPSRIPPINLSQIRNFMFSMDFIHGLHVIACSLFLDLRFHPQNFPQEFRSRLFSDSSRIGHRLKYHLTIPIIILAFFL